MNARRLLATAALLTATAALTACDPAGDPAGPTAAPTTTAATSSAAPSPAPTASRTGAAPRPSASRTGATPRPSASRSSAAPQADCTTAAQRPGHRVINVTAATAGQLTATATVFVCGPDVDDDGYYQPTGGPSTLALAPGASAALVTMGAPEPTRAVPVATLVQHVNDCAAHREPAAPFNCFGGMYDITTDAAGRVTSATELYHP